ncbi:unnamed protein product [Protopolystoma xenopodis]|uniref:Ku70/Ku80 N-terminal alpha/beta domain-containing protein n=1 Tax=Protopolystoma xenopodis TaxID=117903 RepID=A0A3S5CVS0_9PLAT|nr:unnamed protein product [Protopolystoma xenopodis]
MSTASCVVLDIGSHMQDQLALILCGTELTKNDLAEDGDFAHISLVRELGPVDWDILEYLQHTLESTKTTADGNTLFHNFKVLDAVIVAVAYLAKSCRDVVSALSKFELRAVAQRGWKISLEIGPSFKLPIVGFTQIKEALPPPMREYSVADLSHSIQFVNSYQYPDEPEKKIDISDTVRGE